jgi:hypothetical protein
VDNLVLSTIIAWYLADIDDVKHYGSRAEIEGNVVTKEAAAC